MEVETAWTLLNHVVPHVTGSCDLFGLAAAAHPLLGGVLRLAMRRLGDEALGAIGAQIVKMNAMFWECAPRDPALDRARAQLLSLIYYYNVVTGDRLAYETYDPRWGWLITVPGPVMIYKYCPQPNSLGTEYIFTGNTGHVMRPLADLWHYILPPR